MQKLLFIITFSIAVLSNIPVSHSAGDAQAGKAKSAICATCHGPDGNPLAPNFPVIAGQVPGYIEKQLLQFKQGARKDPIMAGMAQPLSTADMQDLDAYYASQKTKQRTVPAEAVNLAKAGESVYRGGNKSTGVPACMACHGPSGHGIAPQFPRLAGQFPTYIQKQLNEYRSGNRTDDLKIMSDIAVRLTKKEISELSAYVGGLK